MKKKLTLPKLKSEKVKPKSKKKKILLLSDDLRMSSGVGTMSREFVLGTLKDFDWVQIGGAIKHPEEGKIIDMSQSLSSEYNDAGSLGEYVNDNLKCTIKKKNSHTRV